MSTKKYLGFILMLFAMLSCGDDNSNPILQLQFNCCGNTSLDNTDINNLDESSGVILPYEVITVNGDGINDVFAPLNIELYPNNEVTIFNANNETVFSETGYGLNNTVFPSNANTSTIPEGTYRYKIIVEDEQTYVNNGFFCLIKPLTLDDLTEYEGQFTTCTTADTFDPFLQ